MCRDLRLQLTVAALVDVLESAVLLRTLVRFSLLALAVGFTACAPPAVETETVNNPLFGGGGSAGATTVHVDPSFGADSPGHGSAALPYKSIYYVFNLVPPLGSGSIVQLASGTYDPTTEANFPLNVPAGVTLLGNEGDKGATIFIVGAGSNGGRTATLTLAAGATIAGITITNPNGAATSDGVYVSGNNGILRNNTLTGNGGYSLLLQSGDGLLLDGNVIFWNPDNVVTGFSASGIYFGPAVTNAVVQNNNASANATGIQIDTTSVDFGLGNLGSVGNNIFACNNDYDIRTSLGAGNTINIQNNWYGNAGIPNAYNPSGATINYAPGNDYAGC